MFDLLEALLLGILVIPLCSVYTSPIIFPSTDDFQSDCRLADGTNGTCLNIEHCASALTAKKVTTCHFEGSKHIVCCKNDLKADFKDRRLTSGCGVPVLSIVGGRQTEYKEFPYMAALGWESLFDEGTYDYKCGGVLVASNYVLTAAHCAILNGLEPSVVLVGGTNLTDPKYKPVEIEQVISHPSYRKNESYHDIALLKLKKFVSETPICIWSLYAMDDTNFTTIGYGHTKFAGMSSDSLLKTHLSFVPNANCSPHYVDESTLPQGIKDTHMCAKDSVNKSDTCQGDSGGPLILHSVNSYGIPVPFVVGITSFGLGCAQDTPGIYTRVSEYVDWMESVIHGNQTNLLYF